MAKVIIVNSLVLDIKKKFTIVEANNIIDLMETLEENPHKGKFLATVGGAVIKELKYNNFRFYFITDGFSLKCTNQAYLVNLLIRFVRMSDKKHQQQTIDEVKHLLVTIGPSAFT